MIELIAAASACVAMFSADSAPNRSGIFITDGTRKKTTLLQNHGDVAYITPIANGAVYSGRIGAKGRELFKSLGSRRSTKILKDINRGTRSSEPRTHDKAAIPDAWDARYRFAKVGNTLVFGAKSESKGFELYATRGTSGSTRLIKDFMPGDGDGMRDVLASTGKYALIVAEDAARGDSLWATNGTGAGTRFLLQERGINGSQGIEATHLLGNKVLFTQDKKNSLWVTNGTAAGTRLVKDFPTCADGSAFGHIKFLKGFPRLGFALFSGCTNASGHELWRSDGTPDGTKLVSNIMIGPDSSEPGGFYRFGKTIVFAANSDGRGRELWKTRGTKGSTKLIADIRRGSSSSEPMWFTRWKSKLIFAAQINGFGFPRLFITNLSRAGTRQVGDVIVKTAFANIGSKLVFGGRFTNATTGNELMGTKGTVSSTELIKDIAGSHVSLPIGITAVRVTRSGGFATPARCPDQ